MPPARRFRIGLAEWMLDARATVEPNQYRLLLEWMAELGTTQLAEVAQTPVGYNELSGIYVRAPSVSLERELLWITERIRIESRRLSAFVAARSELQQTIFTGRYDQALAALDLVERALGASMWLVQFRLATEHLDGGLEQQKQYSAQVRGVYRQGLLPFVTYHTSVRNEDRSTLAKFLTNIESRIERHTRFDDSIKTYLRYRLKNEFPATDAGLAEILRVEQSHGIVDLYDTFITVLQEIVARAPSEARSELVLRCVNAIDLDDFRLDKIRRLIEVDINPALSTRDSRLSDALFAGNLLAARRIAVAERSRFSPDPWHYIYTGFAISGPDRDRGAISSRPTAIAELISRVQSRCDGSDDAAAQLAKLALNLRGLPLGAGLSDFIGQLRRSAPDQAWQPWLIGLNSPFTGPEDRPWSWECALEPTHESVTARVWYETSCPGNEGDYPSRLAIAAGHIHRTSYGSAIAVLGESDSKWPEALRSLRALLSLHAFYSSGDRQKTIELIANEGSRSATHARMLPVAAALRDYGWSDFKSVEHPLAAPVALHMLWSAGESPVVASQMRFATGAAMRRLGVARPSEIDPQIAGVARHELVYFLRYVCVPEVLDLSRLFRGTRAIIEERQNICLLLIEIDPRNRNIYQDEIGRIANELALDEGRWIVDSTRIHVDSDALVRWADKTLAEDFERYRDLTRVSIAEPQNFDEVLRELAAQPAQKTSFVPETEADAVLVSMLRRVGEEFLANASFGLDFYLSKRIRHQSFIGLIRGPLEFSGLITTRESEAGEYRRNDTWVSKFTSCDDEIRDAIDAALRYFAARFDETLSEAKETYLHLRSVDKPQGMIALAVDDRLIRLARAIIDLGHGFREFLTVAISILWAAIEPSLVVIQNFIAVEIKDSLIREFDTVRAKIRELAERDPAWLEFDAAMGKASNEVQVKLDEAAHWFVHADTLKHQQLFTLEQMLAIGVDTALKVQRGYAPVITQHADGDINFFAPNLVFCNDVLFAGLGNARKHSGLKSPRIDISALWNPADETISFTIVSDCKASSRQQKERQADVIRKAIDQGTHGPRTRIEEGSGFAKLAAVVEQSERGKIEFGFTEEGRFRLKVTYAALLLNQELGDDA
ncbi:hypothetical protein [Tsuneonella suprasediminis]|uniref:hypothetical protein n=1 Tax=Tsuneonella suprasediminis TaxID=2306996 RepID=UPI002F9365E8